MKVGLYLIVFVALLWFFKLIELANEVWSWVGFIEKVLSFLPQERERDAKEWVLRSCQPFETLSFEFVCVYTVKWQMRVKRRPLRTVLGWLSLAFNSAFSETITARSVTLTRASSMCALVVFLSYYKTGLAVYFIIFFYLKGRNFH